MARNGSGTYTKVNTFTAGTPITAASHNQNWDDVAAEITNSVAADGQTSMTGPLKAANGSVSAPSQTFAADSDTGRYRKASNTIADVCGGVEVQEISSTGVSITGDVSASGSVKQAGSALLPPGTVMAYCGTSAPGGFLFCYGQSVARATYAALFAAIGTTYGSVDGDSFNLPDIRGRIIAGQDDMGGVSADRLTGLSGGVDGDTLGAVGGSESQALTTAQLPSHNHAVFLNDPGHSHSGTLSTNAESGGSNFAWSAGGGQNNPFTTNSATTGITVRDTTGGGGTANQTATAGSGAAHNNVQPTIILNYIIKT